MTPQNTPIGIDIAPLVGLTPEEIERELEQRLGYVRMSLWLKPCTDPTITYLDHNYGILGEDADRDFL